ncbi:MAG: competence/damage-inducible protein A [Clostridiales bacterium]|nr:competence/damage-inducible protein A [Clostridiales bacterium]
MYSCEIISVGTELLLGDILDTNQRYLSQEAAALGIAVLKRTTVGDNIERLSREINSALKNNDLVLLTGGLGPTADDITKEACCACMGFELKRDEKILRKIEDYFKNKGVVMPPTNAKQADVPFGEGANVFDNTCGTAPGAAIEKDGKCVVFMPGPPREMQAMFEKSVRPFLIKKYSDGVILSHSVRTVGIGESAMAERVADLLDSKNPTVAPYAKEGEALLRVTARAESREDAERLMAPVLNEIFKRLGDKIYDVDSSGLQETVVKLLKQKNLKVAFAESCTAGYLSKRLTDVPGASEVFECGIVSYSNRIKMKVLGVKKETLERYGAVSAQCAGEMAAGVRRISGADICVSVTGVAGPGNDGDIPSGVSYIGVCTDDGVFTERFETKKDSAREYNRYVTSSRALDLIRKQICKNSSNSV